MATALVWCPLAVDAMAVVGQRKVQRGRGEMK